MDCLLFTLVQKSHILILFFSIFFQTPRYLRKLFYDVHSLMCVNLLRLRSRLECIEVNLDDDDDADSDLVVEIQESVEKLAALLKAKQKVSSDTFLRMDVTRFI